MKAVSLFSGCGGFEIGFDRAGIETVLQCEIDPIAQSVLRRHWPDVPKFRDVTVLSLYDASGCSCLDSSEVNSPGVCESVAVRAEHDSVLNGERSTCGGGDDVVSVTEGFRPATIHAGITMPAADSQLPRPFVGVGAAFVDDVRHPFVPSAAGPAALTTSLQLGCGDDAAASLVSGDESPLATVRVESGSCLPTAAAAGPSHESPRHRYHCSILAALTQPVDVVYFGSPCQDLSVAGKRAGMEGERSGLFFEAVRVIRELRPAWAVWENVPGALSSNGGRDFGAVLDSLADAGALDIAWRVLDARWFGVAQRRRRVFLVADFRGQRAGEVLFEPESCGGNPPAGRTTGENVARPLGASATSFGGQRYDLDNETYVATTGVRRLTPLECERLQGWPDEWTKWKARDEDDLFYANSGELLPDSARYRLIGNGVAAPVAEWLGRRLMAVDALLCEPCNDNCHNRETER